MYRNVRLISDFVDAISLDIFQPYLIRLKKTLVLNIILQ